MYVDDQGNVQRIVTVVAMRVEKEDGSVVAQIGRGRDGEVSTSCTLPGTKIRVGELPRDAVERLVDSRLLPYKDGLVWGTSEVTEEQRVSKTYGLSSKYLRTVFH